MFDGLDSKFFEEVVEVIIIIEDVKEIVEFIFLI